MGEVAFTKTPELSFSEKDSEGVLPHDNDPLVIQVHILGWDIKTVLMDTGSSTDIMYWDAFAGMKQTTEQLHPYSGTLVGFLASKW
ncbi:gag-pol polyprotein, partial [Trifolium medium]|nr:gag-pol polyprotein [Trifolium medium]